jgi:hypothetical protein
MSFVRKFSLRIFSHKSQLYLIETNNLFEKIEAFKLFLFLINQLNGRIKTQSIC